MEDNRLPRSEAEYQPLHQRFIVEAKNYSQQYSHLYVVRLSQMRKGLSLQSEQKWGSSVPILARIIDSEGSDKQLGDCVVFGTLFKEMNLRSSVLDEFKEHNGISGGVQPLYNFASKSDFLVLEDDSGRLCLGGSLIKNLAPSAVTGITVAIKGAVDDDGVFQVSDILFSGEKNISPKRSENENGENSEDEKDEQNKMEVAAIPSELADDSTYLLLASGLNIGQGGPGTKSVPDSTDLVENSIASQMLMDYISGRLGGHTDVTLASRIVRVIIAGNSVVTGDIAKGKDRYTGSKLQAAAILPMKELDCLLATALGSCPFDVMPGPSDPANISLPQQPLHPCLLPNSARFKSLNLVTNPYEANVGDINILGHSGQPIKSIARQTVRKEILQSLVGDDDIVIAGNEISDEKDESEKGGRETGDRPITILGNTLRWGHLCPTAPDTLPCHPFTDLDPFVIEPNNDVTKRIFFAGNQDCFETSLEVADGKMNRLVCIPAFSKTKQVVLVNLQTLDCTPISFLSFPNFDDLDYQ